MKIAKKNGKLCIFSSIDGEVTTRLQGGFSLFIRLAGCNLRCSYCDTPYALEKDSGIDVPLIDLVDIIRLSYPELKNITITGGEPLLQRSELIALIRELNRVRDEYSFSIETNGTMSILDSSSVSYVVDYKIDESKKMNMHDCFYQLSRNDFVKFVVRNTSDIYKAIEVKNNIKVQIKSKREREEGFIMGRPFPRYPKFAISPIHGLITPSEIVDFLKKEREYEFILNLQLHKYIWPNAIEEV